MINLILYILSFLQLLFCEYVEIIYIATSISLIIVATQFINDICNKYKHKLKNPKIYSKNINVSVKNKLNLFKFLFDSKIKRLILTFNISINKKFSKSLTLIIEKNKNFKFI